MQNLYIGKLGYQIRIYCIALESAVATSWFKLLLLLFFPINNILALKAVSMAVATGSAYFQSVSASKPHMKRLTFSLADMTLANLSAPLLCRISANSLPLEPKLFLPLQNKFISAVAMDGMNGSFAGALRAICQSMILKISISQLKMRWSSLPPARFAKKKHPHKKDQLKKGVENRKRPLDKAGPYSISKRGNPNSLPEGN